MTDRKTLKTSPEIKDRLDELKRDGETTNGLLNRACDALETDENQGDAPRCTECHAQSHVWTVEAGNLVCGVCADGEISVE